LEFDPGRMLRTGANRRRLAGERSRYSCLHVHTIAPFL
jgi:hypothetical protein